MQLPLIRERLAAYQPRAEDDPRVARAAVALVLRGSGDDAEVLFIRRAVRDHDPWSGHVAFPGGRRDPADRTLADTAARETLEEVGIDLAAHAQPLGALDDLRAVARTRAIDLVISPYVYELERAVEPCLDPNEVRATTWVSLRYLRSPEARSTHRWSWEGNDYEFPAYRYHDYTIWGLTYRILETFFEVVAD